MQHDELSFRITYLVISLATVVALIILASTYAEPVLRVSLMPDEAPSILRRKVKLLTDYLEKKIGMKIEFRPAASGDTMVKSLVNHDLDLVWIDGFYFDLARSRSGGRIMSLVRRDETNQTAFSAAPGYRDYTWTVRADMDATLRQKLTDAFLALDRSNGQEREILDLQHAGRFIPIKAEN